MGWFLSSVGVWDRVRKIVPEVGINGLGFDLDYVAAGIIAGVRRR